MAKKPGRKGRRPLEDIPAFMLPDVGKGSEAVSSTSIAWVGEDGSFDPDEALAVNGHDSRSPLEMIVRAIVNGNPSTARCRQTRDERVDIAISALLGKPRNPGRNSNDDESILVLIGSEYHRVRFDRDSAERRPVELAPIVRSCIERFAPNGLHSIDSEVRRLTKKFDRQKDLWLARATSQDNPDRLNAIRNVRQILILLAELNVRSHADSVIPSRIVMDEMAR